MLTKNMLSYLLEKYPKTLFTQQGQNWGIIWGTNFRIYTGCILCIRLNLISKDQKYHKNVFGPTDEVRSYGFALVRPSVSQSVSYSGRFHSNGSLKFSDFWYKGSFLLLLKTDGTGFSKKIFLGQKWRNRCEK